ncbi:hypothetical protein TM48_03193 [Mycobacterium shottsii]|uniref:Uncharacterized protein n=2 Tax=Mycobacterium shottsii TaxID=133549 RepID=A0A7I7LGG8_9MYCO|nr:GAP family protein [Mycobacterium shottsii]QYL28812.1 hypothetical protein TM48_03193 [Mycobacterium shottsii]BBX58908.1 hypothetical protein MSHO_42530 [Mycobacterium shottsii]
MLPEALASLVAQVSQPNLDTGARFGPIGAPAGYSHPVSAMWSSLLPLILGSLLEPIELAITIMLLGTPARTRTAGAWIAGHGCTRLLQGLVFGTILHWGARRSAPNHAHHWIVSTVLLIVALIFLVTAAREFFGDNDPEAPPPKWMAMPMSATPTRAFLIGAGLVTVSVKSWVFTLAAISVIGNAGLPRVGNMASYVLFVLLALSTNLLVVAMAALFPDQSRALLDRIQRWLQDNDRPIMIVVGLGFGIWFGFKALHGLGVI